VFGGRGVSPERSESEVGRMPLSFLGLSSMSVCRESSGETS